MYSPLRHLPSVVWKKRPIQLTFFVTRKCNARCPFCFYLAGADQPDRGAAELSLAEIRKISASLGRMLWIAFSGGEPYLRKDLAEISKIFHDQNRPSVMLYPTNGLLPETICKTTERILQNCPDSVIVVKISIDELGAAHDDMRKTPGGFDKAVETYRRLAPLARRYANLELGINTVFCSRNQDEMDRIIDFVRDLEGVKTHTISMIRGDLVHAHYKDVDIGKYRRATGRLEADLLEGTSDIHGFRGGRLKAAQDIVQRRLIYRTLCEQRRLVPCYSGKLNLVLSESGDVYPCEIQMRSFGNVRDYGHDVGKLLRSPAARAALETHGNLSCHCTHECYFITNILFNPRLYPTLARECFRLSKGRSAGPAVPGVRSGAVEQKPVDP
ncbi:pyrroloquinoline quinone biosynthesis protein PqqE [bacterium BMS3Bbin10]|nr:pyrroloquinoline quinone biosynthesis protein PqqE [bacterium BMS3Bbin10]